VIGTYVTAGARVHLYKYLDLLQERAIYCDTDFVLYIQKESEPRFIEIGDNLGDMTDELKPGEHIDEFVSGGPKNCAYTICNQGASKSSVCNVRGITLNISTSHFGNFDVIRDMILKGEPESARCIRTRSSEREKGAWCQSQNQRISCTGNRSLRDDV
jgi:hypothetical protein